MAAAPVEIVIFELAAERYGIAAASVREVLRAVKISPVPREHAGHIGIINLRGRIVGVFDPRPAVGLPPKAVEHSDNLLVIQLSDRLAAIAVDRALELRRLSRPDQTADARMDSTCVICVANEPDGLVLILDPERLIACVVDPAPTLAVASHAVEEPRA